MAKIPKLSCKEFAYAVFGMLLGDGCLTKSKNGQRQYLVIEHGPKQDGYARYKAEFLRQHSRRITVKTKKTKTDWDDEYTTTVVRANINKCVVRHLNKFDRLYFDNRTKIASKYVMRRINAMGLLFWFMDDGTASVTLSKNKKGYLITNRFFRLGTYGFDAASKRNISRCLKDRFNIHSNVTKAGHLTLHNLGVKGMQQYIDAVRPHLNMVPRVMRYKFTMEYPDEEKALMYSPWGTIRSQVASKRIAPLEKGDDIFQSDRKLPAAINRAV